MKDCVFQVPRPARTGASVLKILLLLWTSLLFSTAAFPQQLYDRSWAVVIGIDNYQHWPHLQAAVADAKAMAQRLREMGFEPITYLANAEATRDRILTEIGTRLSRDTGPNDRVFIYFAGHGYTEELPNGDQVGYLIPADCPQSNFFTYAISMQQIRETFSRMRAKHIYYVIDACFSGYGFTRGAGMVPGARGYLQVVTEKRAVQMITAGRKGDLAHEEKGHGIFTLYLLRGLRGEADLNGDGLVTATELGGYVQPNVYQASGQRQLPQYGRLEGEGEVVFLVGEAPREKEAREKIQALEKELSQLQQQRKSLEGKKELLLTDIMKLDVEIRQNREKAQMLEKELEQVRAAMEPPRPQVQSRPSPPQIQQGERPPVASQPPQSVSRFKDMGNGTVLDSRTGLLWEKGGSPRPVRFSEAQAHVEKLNQERFGGYSDWRVPRLEELQSLLVEKSHEGLRLDPLFDRRVPACWSSTQYAVGAQKHHAGLDFKDGTVLTRSELTEGYHVRAVRGKSD
ncbi:MAG: DUF1566 domain-containing protein [bacterium]